MTNNNNISIRMHGEPVFEPVTTRFNADTSVPMQQYIITVTHPEPDTVLDVIVAAREGGKVPFLTFAYDEDNQLRYSRIVAAHKGVDNGIQLIHFIVESDLLIFDES